MLNKTLLIFALILAGGLMLAMTACSSSPAEEHQSGDAQGDRPKVVATTTIVGDVVRNVGGDAIDLVVLLPHGVDPHSFQPSPRDIARIVEADLIFMNGAGLERFMPSLLENVTSDTRVVDVSQGIALLQATDEDEHATADSPPPSGEPRDGHEGADPHIWTDPNNVLVWVSNIEHALSAIDPGEAALYRSNAEQYRQALVELDVWVRQQVAQIPEANRELVTEHSVLGYFAARYGFRQVGAVIPGFSTLSEPSAQELASLEDTIRQLGVRAVLVGNTVNPSLAKRLADDTGTRLITFYSDSLTGPEGPAGTYLDMIRYNVDAFVEALK